MIRYSLAALALLSLFCGSTVVEARIRGGVAATTCPTDDGSAGAVAATIQAPTLLDGYPAANTVRSLGCKVAGVDYGTGVPTGTSLVDWQSVTCSGCTQNAHFIRVDGNNTTFDGVDFSLHGTAYVYASSTATGTLTVKNSKFGCPTPDLAGESFFIHSQATTLNMTVTNNNFDGTGCNGATQGAFVILGGEGTLTFQYNWNIHGQQQVVNTGGGFNAQTLDYRFNFIEDIAIETAGNHLNYLQTYGSTGTVVAIVEHNTSWQHTSRPSDHIGGEGYQFEEYTTFANPLFRYNTMISTMDGIYQTMSNMVHGNCPTGATPACGTNQGSLFTTGGLNIGNYFDTSGCITQSDACAYYAGTMTAARGWTSAGNKNMTTGATITPQ